LVNSLASRASKIEIASKIKNDDDLNKTGGFEKTNKEN
jgi:hypothetical protein